MSYYLIIVPTTKITRESQLCGWMELVYVQLGEMAQCLANMGQRLQQKRQDRVQMLNPNIPRDHGA